MQYNNKQFKEIPGFKNYFCSEDGDVYSDKTKRILTANYNTGKMQYPTVQLYVASNQKCMPIHKLIALTWCPLPEGYTAKDVIGNWMSHNLVVDHIDGNKMNFKASNLRWCTALENISYNNYDRTTKVEALKGNKNAKNKTTPKNCSKIRYMYHYNGKDYNMQEICTELDCTRSKITESFRRNLGLVRLGKLTRTPILTKTYQIELAEELDGLIKKLGENINDENNIEAARAREIIDLFGWNKGDKND